MTVAGVGEKLRAIAQELRAHPEHWTTGHSAKDAAGCPTHPRDHGATCWCSLGLLTRDFESSFICFDLPYAASLLDKAIGEFPAHRELRKAAAYNDAPGRTAAEVADAFDRAAQLAEASP